MSLHLITGGIGSGKSRVRSGLATLGWDTADADEIGHLVLEEEASAPVAERFPSAVGPDGRIDRVALGRIVFDDAQALTDLEELTHPHIRRRIETLADDALLEASNPTPELLATVTTVIVVDAPSPVRKARLIERGMQPQDIERRIANQRSRKEWLAAADMVIPNESTLERLDHRIALLDRWLRQR